MGDIHKARHLVRRYFLFFVHSNKVLNLWHIRLESIDQGKNFPDGLNGARPVAFPTLICVRFWRQLQVNEAEEICQKFCSAFQT